MVPFLSCNSCVIHSCHISSSPTGSRLAKFDVCATYQKDQQKEPLISHKIPNPPWETVGCDIFHFEDRDYLCAVDYYSSYFEIDQLKDRTGNEVIGTLKRHFQHMEFPTDCRLRMVRPIHVFLVSSNSL